MLKAYLTTEGAVGLSIFTVGFLISFFAVARSHQFRALDYSILSMSMVYGLAMPLVFHQAADVRFAGAEYILRSPSTVALHLIAVALCFCGVLIGWRMTSRRIIRKCEVFFNCVDDRTLKANFVVMVLLAISCWYVYVIDYGGFWGYFDYNMMIRSQMFEVIERSRFSFLQPFGGFAIFACLGFWGLLIWRPTRTINTGILFLASFILSMYILAANAGRIDMSTAFAIFALSIVHLRRPHPLSWFFSFFFLVFLGFILLYWASNFLNLKGSADLSSYIIREVSFPISSFFAQIERGYLFHMFSDVFLLPLFLIPSSLSAPWLTDAGAINTEVVLGFRKGVSGNTTSVPVDILTFGVMQFHLVGVFIYACLFGFFVRLCDALARSFSNPGLRSVFQIYVYIKIAMLGVFYAQPKQILMTHFPLIVFVIFWVMLKSLRR